MRNVEVAGVRLSAIGLGTWQFGSAEWGYGADYAAVESARLVERALDLGVNLIDTAEVYAWGRSERLVGAALGDRRDEAFVATKLFPVAPLASVVVQDRLLAAGPGPDLREVPRRAVTGRRAGGQPAVPPREPGAGKGPAGRWPRSARSTRPPRPRWRSPG